MAVPAGSNEEQKILPDEVFPLPEGVEWDYQNSIFRLDSAYIRPLWSNSLQRYRWEQFPNWYNLRKVQEKMEQAFPTNIFDR